MNTSVRSVAKCDIFAWMWGFFAAHACSSNLPVQTLSLFKVWLQAYIQQESIQILQARFNFFTLCASIAE